MRLEVEESRERIAANSLLVDRASTTSTAFSRASSIGPRIQDLHVAIDKQSGETLPQLVRRET